MKTVEEETAVHKLRTEVWKETNPADFLILDYQPPGLCLTPESGMLCHDSRTNPPCLIVLYLPFPHSSLIRAPWRSGHGSLLPSESWESGGSKQVSAWEDAGPSTVWVQGPSGFTTLLSARLHNARAQAASLALAGPWEVAPDCLTRSMLYPPHPPASPQASCPHLVQWLWAAWSRQHSDAIISQDVQVHLSLQDQSAHGLVGSWTELNNRLSVHPTELWGVDGLVRGWGR